MEVEASDQNQPEGLVECPVGEHCSALFVVTTLIQKSWSHFQELFLEIKAPKSRLHDYWFLESEDFGALPEEMESEPDKHTSNKRKSTAFYSVKEPSEDESDKPDPSDLCFSSSFKTWFLDPSSVPGLEGSCSVAS